jgi:hypothetical protein
LAQKSVAYVLAFVLVVVGVSQAQTYYDRMGTTINGVVPVPYPFIPLSPGQHGIAPASPTGLTIPVGTRLANVCASTSVVRYTTDGTTIPTASIGQPLLAGSCIQISGSLVLSNFRAISAAGTLDIEYFQ